MTTKMTQYSTEMLDTWRTSRLGCLYLNCYLASRESPEDESQLERIAQILTRRPLEELRSIKYEIKRELRAASRDKNKAQTDLYLGMLNHYIEKVLQPHQE